VYLERNVCYSQCKQKMTSIRGKSSRTKMTTGGQAKSTGVSSN